MGKFPYTVHVQQCRLVSTIFLLYEPEFLIFAVRLMEDKSDIVTAENLIQKRCRRLFSNCMAENLKIFLLKWNLKTSLRR
jgi:hypothetical protein